VVGIGVLGGIAGQGGVKVCGAPGTLSLSEGGTPATQIALSWSAPSDTGGGTVSGYRIKKDGSTLVADTGSTGTTYTATGLTRVTSYNFNVAAINEVGTGADGNTPSLTTSAEVPGAPGTLSLSAGSPAQTAINLSWSAPSDTGGATITGYRIKKDGSTLVADTGSTSTTYSATGLSSSTSYNFTVAAINSIGTGTDGNTPSRTTTDYFITASGGTVTTQGNYKVHTFTGTSTFSISSNPSGKTFDVLVVAGGAGGGWWGGNGCGCGGGGGGGGYGGGYGSAGNWSGGNGGTYGANGGSARRDSQGSNNYYSQAGGGGGGASGTGANGAVTSPAGYPVYGGDGGSGLGNTYQTGSTQYYGGGGGGGAAQQYGPNQAGTAVRGDGGSGGGGYGARSDYDSWDNQDAASAGTANTGGGGGGGSRTSHNGGNNLAGAGGSGIVIVRYRYQ
jgi:hypothetical protein